MKINDLEKVTELEREYYELVEAIRLLGEIDAISFFKKGFENQILLRLQGECYESDIKKIKKIAIKMFQIKLNKVIEKLKVLGVEV